MSWHAPGQWQAGRHEGRGLNCRPLSCSLPPPPPRAPTLKGAAPVQDRSTSCAPSSRTYLPSACPRCPGARGVPLELGQRRRRVLRGHEEGGRATLPKCAEVQFEVQHGWHRGLRQGRLSSSNRVCALFLFAYSLHRAPPYADASGGVLSAACVGGAAGGCGVACVGRSSLQYAHRWQPAWCVTAELCPAAALSQDGAAPAAPGAGGRPLMIGCDHQAAIAIVSRRRRTELIIPGMGHHPSVSMARNH